MPVTDFVGNNNAETGVCFGKTPLSKIGLYGVTPVVQAASANQAAVDSTAITGPITTPATSTTPFGFATGAQADAIVAAVNSLITRVEAMRVLQAQLRTDLIALGAIKGAA